MKNKNKEIKYVSYNENNLDLLADTAIKKENLYFSKYDEVKEFIFLEINKLKEYAIYYQKNIKSLEVKEINNLIENEFSKKLNNFKSETNFNIGEINDYLKIENIMQKHNYSKLILKHRICS